MKTFLAIVCIIFCFGCNQTGQQKKIDNAASYHDSLIQSVERAIARNKKICHETDSILNETNKLIKYEDSFLSKFEHHPMRHSKYRVDSSNIHIETHGDHSPAIISNKDVIIKQ